MKKNYDRKAIRNKKHKRMRFHLQGTADRPRLSVFRSARHIYAQIIDDSTGRTLVSASTLKADIEGRKTEQAHEVGLVIGKKRLNKASRKWSSTVAAIFIMAALKHWQKAHVKPD